MSKSTQNYSTGCHRKVKLVTLADAEVRAERKTEEYGELLVPYECHFCKGFHIGHHKPIRRIR